MALVVSSYSHNPYLIQISHTLAGFITSTLLTFFLLVLLPGLSNAATESPTSHTALEKKPKLGDSFTEPLVNMEFTYIEPGNFMMGSPKSEKNRYRDERLHRVDVEQGFWFGKFEVTFAQYDAFCKAAGYLKPTDKGWGRNNRPAINVRWHEATAFAKWMSSKTGLHYRLPTEAEWEYVARSGTTTAYSFGDDAADFRDYAWNGDSANRQTHPVGLKKANPWNVYDIHGNVWEWTGSVYAQDYDGSELSQYDFKSKNSYAVVRGGAWYFFPKGMRSADRRRYQTYLRLPYIGFRLVRDN